jgi:hypothetical protein
VSLRPFLLARTPKSACFDQIQQLRQHFGDEMTCTLLGLNCTAALGFKDQPSPAVRRLAYVLHRITFKPGVPASLFDLLTCGKYDRTPQETGPLDGDWTI